MGRALWEKAGGDQDVSPRRRPAPPLCVQEPTHEGSEVPLAAGPRGGWRAWDGSSSTENLAWPLESSHSPHCSPTFVARVDNSPLQIQAASLPREQLAPSLCWEQAPDVTSLLPAPTQTGTVPDPGCRHTSLCLCTTPLSPRARPAPLHHPDGLPPADTAALHPTPARGHCPRSTRTWGHRTARGVTASLQAMAKGSQPRGDTAGHGPLPVGVPEQ